MALAAVVGVVVTTTSLVATVAMVLRVLST
jgi:hypothetical protein